MAGVYTGSKWGQPGMGVAGGQVTFSFASLAGQLVDFDGVLSALPFQNAVRAAFNVWEAVADIDFVEIADGAGSDIRLGWDAIDGAGGTLGQASWQFYGQTTIYAEIGFDLGESWAVAGLSNRGTDFLAVAIHEIGHAIGLSHVDDRGSIMHAYLGSQHGLSDGDVSAIQALYGAPEGEAPPAAPASGGGIVPPPALPGPAAGEAESDPGSVFRFYNEKNGVHFYTGSAAEKDVILSTLGHMRFEGEAFDTPTDGGGGAAIEIYRFWNAKSGAHFYTASEAERDLVAETLHDFAYEGVAFYGHDGDGGGAHQALHRFYNEDTGTHFYTASDAEQAAVDATLPQYRYEGVAYYVEVA